MTTSVVNQLSTADVLHAYGEGIAKGREALANEIQRRGAYTLHGAETRESNDFAYVITYPDGSLSVATLKGVSNVYQQIADGAWDGAPPTIFVNDPEADEPLLQITARYAYGSYDDNLGVATSHLELTGEPRGVPFVYATIATYTN